MLSVSREKLCNRCLSSSAPSSSTIGNNCDLIAAILYCLPANSLCVFKTVSKQWLSLITDPYFGSNYNIRRRGLSMPALFMTREVMAPLSLSVKESDYETMVMDERKDIDYVPFRIKFRQSCNGLVLYELEYAFMAGGFRTQYIIHNPSMNHCKTLPSHPFRKNRVWSVTLAFDPAKSSYYEVVFVSDVDNTRRGIYHIEIYSSETDSWRDARDPITLFQPHRLPKSGVYWNGSVHWIDQGSATLHYFDIDSELVKRIAMPTQPEHSGRYIPYFNVCRGHIHLMEMCKDGMPLSDIWEMRMDYSGWDVKYHVDLTPLITAYPGIVEDKLLRMLGRFDFSVLLVMENEDSSRLILRIEKNKVISFDLINKSFKEMYDVKPDFWVEGFEYVETLAHA